MRELKSGLTLCEPPEDGPGVYTLLEDLGALYGGERWWLALVVVAGSPDAYSEDVEREGATMQIRERWLLDIAVEPR